MAFTTRVVGRVGWTSQRDDDGHREYTVRFRVEVASHLIGPQTVTWVAGLPQIGDPWIYGTDNDPWAFCTPYLKATPQTDEENNFYWILEYKFKTMPLSRCNDTTIENPLAEPWTIRGAFSNNRIKATQDKDGDAIQTSSFEEIEVDFDQNYPVVELGQNVLNLGLSTFASAVNKVNDDTLWGMPARTIKLSNVSWERRLYGVCSFYYNRVFYFEINPSTFDRTDVPNRGGKLIHGEPQDDPLNPWLVTDFKGGGGAPDPTNPTHYVIGVDRNGNPISNYIDAPTGLPSSTPTYVGTVEYYGVYNFLSLGIPSSIA